MPDSGRPLAIEVRDECHNKMICRCQRQFPRFRDTYDGLKYLMSNRASLSEILQSSQEISDGHEATYEGVYSIYKSQGSIHGDGHTETTIPNITIGYRFDNGRSQVTIIYVTAEEPAEAWDE